MAGKEKAVEVAESSSEDTGKETEKSYSQADMDKLQTDKKGLERAISEGAKQIKRLEDSQTDMQSLRQEVNQNMQLMAAMVAEGRPPEDAEGLSSAEKGDYLKKAQALIAENETKRTGEQYRKKVEALGLTRDDDDYWEIEDMVSRGRYEAADARLRRLEPKAEEPKETEDIDKLVEEKLRAKLEEEGKLQTETGSPSGSGGLSSFSAEDLKEKMNDPKFFAEHEEEIDKLYAEGKFFNK